MTEKPYKLATRAVIRDCLGRCLLLKRSFSSKNSAGKWELPGGKVDTGETFDQALRREVTEETGLEVSFQHVVGAVEIEMADFRVAQLILEAKAISTDVRLSNEHTEYRWVEPENLLKLELSAYLLSFIKNYAQALI